jgi:hypothetical protein
MRARAGQKVTPEVAPNPPQISPQASAKSG